MQIINSEVITLTPDVAEQLLRLNTYKHQRTLRQTHVNFLANEMIKGQFTQAQIGLAQVVGGGLCIVNGQHTLNAVKKSGVSLCNVTLTNYIVDNDEDLAHLYRTIDRNLARGIADTLATSELTEKLGITKTSLAHLASAVKYIKQLNAGKTHNAFSEGKIDSYEIIGLIKHYHSMFMVYESISLGSSLHHNVRHRADVLSLALITIEHATDKAELYWKGVVQDDGLGKNDLRKKANKFLLTTKIAGGAIVGGLSRPEMIISLVDFWNKWNKAKPSQDPSKLPIALTPIVLNVPKKKIGG